MSLLLFVYGTLKEGFPNHHRNSGRRVPGAFRTVLPYPLLVVALPHEARAPWLMAQPGQGHQVSGEVFEVPLEALGAMDDFEEVGQPQGYSRALVQLEPTQGDGPGLTAWAYFKQAEQLPEALTVEGPFPCYTLALAQGYSLGQLA